MWPARADVASHKEWLHAHARPLASHFCVPRCSTALAQTATRADRVRGVQSRGPDDRATASKNCAKRSRPSRSSTLPMGYDAQEASCSSLFHAKLCTGTFQVQSVTCQRKVHEAVFF